MRRFFAENVEYGQAIFAGTEAAHMRRVLRIQPGDEVLAIWGGMEHVCQVERVTESEVAAKVLETRPCAGEPRRELALFLAYMKSDKMELVAQKATELGITSYQPFLSARCVKTPEGRAAEKAQERMARVSIEACKQCGRAKPMQVALPVPFRGMLELLAGYETVIFAYENAVFPLADALERARQRSGSVALVVGAEGGFTEKEAAVLAAAGAMQVSLGSRILRGETAAIALSAIAAYETGC